MKCNFRKQIVYRDNEAIIKDLAVQAACAQLEDVGKRARYFCMAAMLNAGLSVKTVNRVVKEFWAVREKYDNAAESGVGDAMLLRDLRNAGLEVEDFDNEV